MEKNFIVIEISEIASHRMNNFWIAEFQLWLIQFIKLYFLFWLN